MKLDQANVLIAINTQGGLHSSRVGLFIQDEHGEFQHLGLVTRIHLDALIHDDLLTFEVELQPKTSMALALLVKKCEAFFQDLGITILSQSGAGMPTDRYKPLGGHAIGPWHNYFAWTPVRTYDYRIFWLRMIRRRRLQKNLTLPGPPVQWWQYKSVEEPEVV